MSYPCKKSNYFDLASFFFISFFQMHILRLAFHSNHPLFASSITKPRSKLILIVPTSPGPRRIMQTHLPPAGTCWECRGLCKFLHKSPHTVEWSSQKDFNLCLISSLCFFLFLRREIHEVCNCFATTPPRIYISPDQCRMNLSSCRETCDDDRTRLLEKGDIKPSTLLELSRN